MDSGLRYTPNSDKDWDTSVQFLPASDNKKLEKKKGPGKIGAVIGVVIFAAVIALMTGLLVWHFHFRKDVRIKKMYSGSMRITNQVFENAYENANSSEFKALAKQVTAQVRLPLRPPLPCPQKLSSCHLHLHLSCVFFCHSCSVTNQIDEIQSPGFPNSPYPPNTFIQWQLRADPSYVIKLEFDTVNLEEDCKNDFVKIYDSLVAIESRVMDEICGYYSPSEPLTFLSSGNVMLVTMATNDKKNYPGFRAKVSQVRKGSTSCGGQLTGEKGTFSSPNFPNYYPPRTSCQWSIEVPKGKAVKVTFNKFLMSEPGQGKDCRKDYVEINGKKLCGDQPVGTVTETSDTNKMSVVFFSDASYVDKGFDASFEAIDVKDPCPKQFQCNNQRCIKLDLKCDGWNDCGDMSDEINCKCSAESINCKNGLCKPVFWKCDGINDCGDGTDELNCGCKAGQVACKNNKCVSEKNRCDGRDDCGDGSDELNCDRGSDISCTDLTYRCKNNKCISKVNPECDGTQDCDDGSDEENCDCGRSMFKTSRIVGGQDAEEGEFPWQVSLHVKSYGHVCGASIISPNWLVTAAHCVQDDGRTRYSQPGTWEAYLGLHTQRNVNSAVVKRNLKQIIPHPNYNAYTFDNDIALMELESPVSYSDYIRPICLPASQHDFPVGNTVWITGWGATREGGFAASVLQKAQVRIINHSVCNNLMGGQLTSRMLCAGVLTGGVDACQGDSGGPLSSPSSTRMFLAGVVSWGDGCARRNKPGIYTAVTKFRGWIKEKTGV
uniref:ST14 transmembrane serine protease matriptase a n=1 Tax=Lates calcarifer TaxID=8187 RepID=A0A4W6CDW6_LATCA